MKKSELTKIGNLIPTMQPFFASYFVKRPIFPAFLCPFHKFFVFLPIINITENEKAFNVHNGSAVANSGAGIV